MKRVLLTGASGFIGRHALAALRARSYEVHAVARSLPPVQADVLWHVGDLLDPAVAPALMRKIRPSHFLHLAWYAEHGLFWTAMENFRWVGASLNLLDAFRAVGGQRVVMAGSCAEYDLSAGVCDEESTPLRPNTVYGTCKNAMHSLFEAYCTRSGLSGAWGRVFHLFGPQEHPARLVSSVCIALLRGEDALCTHGRQLRDFLHVADVADAFAALLDSEVQGAVNIGSGSPLTIGELAGRIAAVVGRPQAVKLGARAAPAGEPPTLIPVLKRLREDVGWTAADTLDARLETTIQWWRQQQTER